MAAKTAKDDVATLVRAQAAEDRIYAAARRLNLGSLLLAVPLKAHPAIPTAAWCFNRQSGSVEIRVNPRLALELPLACLEALLLHELMHHVGFNDELHRFPRQASPTAVNLALDIALERVLSQTPHGEALDELNDRLLLSDLPESPVELPSDAAAVLLVHRRAPLDRMPRKMRAIWKYLWKDPVELVTPVEIWRHVGAATAGAPLLDARGNSGGMDSIHLDEIIVRGVPSPGDIGESAATESSPVSSVTESIREALVSRSSRHGEGRSAMQTYLAKPSREVSSKRHDKARALFLRRGVRGDKRIWVRRCLEHLYPHCGLGTVTRRAYLVRPTRSELVRRSVGWPSVMYSNRAERGMVPINVFVDVSGSMEDVSSDVVALLESLRAWLPSRLHLFDTTVKTIDTASVFSGRWWSGGGTAFNVVFEFALERGYAESLVITDGCSEVDDELLRRFRARGLGMCAVLFSGAVGTPSTDWWNRWVVIE